MKKYVIFVLNVIVLFSITNVYAEEAVTEIKTVEDKVGWVTENGNTYYYENNQKVSGFKTIDNKLYFFSRVNYALKKGWQNAKEGKWYQNSNGEVVKGLQTIDKNKYYFDDNGIWGHSNSKEIPSKNDFIKGSPFCHAPCMIRKKVLSEVGRYTVDSKLLRVEDYHLWFKIYAKGYVGYNIQEPLYKMRDDNDAYIRRNWKNRINEARVRFIGYKMLKLPIYSYIYCLRPIVLFFLPSKLYLVLHKKNKKEESKDEKI